MKLKEYQKVELAAGGSRPVVGQIGVAILFVVLVMIFVGNRFAQMEQVHLLVAAAVIGA